ncbi:MAG: flagellar basal body-associated FliL family protein [Candidatus Eisenbacteria bacterium]
MTEEAKKPAEGEAKAPAEGGPPPAVVKSAGPPLLVTIIVSVLTLSVGAVTGTMLVGPAFFGKAAPAKQAHADEEAESEEPEGHKSGGKHGEGEKSVFMKLENIIVSPSGSQGARFLMVSVAIGLPSEKVGAKLRDHEAEVRDAVIGALERQTMESLTQPGARDQIKSDIAAALAPIAGKGKKLQIFLPQFVIQ